MNKSHLLIKCIFFPKLKAHLIFNVHYSVLYNVINSSWFTFQNTFTGIFNFVVIVSRIVFFFSLQETCVPLSGSCLDHFQVMEKILHNFTLKILMQNLLYGIGSYPEWIWRVNFGKSVQFKKFIFFSYFIRLILIRYDFRIV